MIKRITRSDMAKEIYEDKWQSLVLRRQEYKCSETIFLSEEIQTHQGGRYITVTSPQLLSLLSLKDSLTLSTVIAREILLLSNDERKVMVVGIGNREMTVDSLGVLTAELISPYPFTTENDYSLTVIIPGVKAATGISVFDSVKAISDIIHPSLIVAVDALAARIPSSLGKLIQISNIGITPGSGLGRRNSTLNNETLGIPVISIGVPTVIASDVMLEEYTEQKYEAERFYVALSESDAVVDTAARIIARAIEKAFGEG